MRRAAIWLMLIGVIAGVYAFINPDSGMLPVCPFYHFTHLYCPGCGSQRALHALMHGQWGAAMGYNPLMVLSLGYFAAEVGIWALRQRGSAIRSIASYVQTPRVVFALVMLFWVLRNIPVKPFSLLAP